MIEDSKKDNNPKNDLDGSDYTSDPFVLVEYYDVKAGEYGMSVYKIDKKDDSPELGYAKVQATIAKDAELKFTTATKHPFRDGEPVELQSIEGNLTGVSAGTTYYLRRTSDTEFSLAANPTGPAIQGQAKLATSVTVLRLFPYDFHYSMRAGDTVEPPYPLGTVIGLQACHDTSGIQGAAAGVKPAPPYWEDHLKRPWAVSAGEFPVYFYYPLRSDFWFNYGSGAAANTIQATKDGTAIDDATCIRFLPADYTDELKSVDDNKTPPQEVLYTSVWPDQLPILKVGETLTFAGGEYRSDHPEAPGLPGVVGWASGNVVFDSLNPTMSNTKAFSQYGARLVSPLEERRVNLQHDVGLSDAEIQTFREKIAPATGIVEVDGVMWRFAKLPASLKKRVFFDPLNNEIGIQGYLNDKAIGDSTLTQSPPPVYVLEPNILTPSEQDKLKSFKADKAEQSAISVLFPKWNAIVDKLYAETRNPHQLHDPAATAPDASGYYVGLEFDAQRDSNGNPYHVTSQGEWMPGSAKPENAAKLKELQKNAPDGFHPMAHPNEMLPRKDTAQPLNALGPGLALVPSPHLLEPDSSKIWTELKQDPSKPMYVTLVENNDPEVGGPVTMHIVKILKKHRYRGAIKTILAKNVFAEKITLRHSGDFGANADDIVYQWFYRGEDGTSVPVPEPDTNPISWTPFAVPAPVLPNTISGQGVYQIDVEGDPLVVLRDNVFFVRYRHKDDTPSAPDKWSGAPSYDPQADAGEKAKYNTEWFRDGRPAAKIAKTGDGEWLPERDGTTGLVVKTHQGEWAGAGNSPSVDLVYRPQLAMGWIKRVLDRVNLYEARFADFRDTEAPADYISMIQEAGPRYEGPVALNADKNVVENVGLIQLYQTVLERGKALSIKNPQFTADKAVFDALQLAATRLQDLHMLLGNEAYADAQDPTIGFGSEDAAYGSAASSVWTFMNETASPLDEELALLRGVRDSFGRPVFNRLFWNFMKGRGEMAYATNYNLSDENDDGFVNETDAMLRYPQGHGDAWGHYSVGLKMHYDLLQNEKYKWQPRSELYNLLDVVIPVDFLDERKFAAAAATRAKAGSQIVDLTYRNSYLEDPTADWPGYNSPRKEFHFALPPNKPTPSLGNIDPDWSVVGWSRRAGQGAYFDWITANSMIPAHDEKHTVFEDANGNGEWDEDEAVHTKPGESLQRVDRFSVTAISQIPAEFAKLQCVLQDTNAGLNPLGLDNNVMPFDIDPLAFAGAPGIPGITYFQQIYARAVDATKNAADVFDQATKRKNNLRSQQDAADAFHAEVISANHDLEQQLIAIFGTPYEGMIGPGKLYPPGYEGPDLFLYMYVDVNDLNNRTVPGGPDKQMFEAVMKAFTTEVSGYKAEFHDVFQTYYMKALPNNTPNALGFGDDFQKKGGADVMNADLITGSPILDLDLPTMASGYAFQAPEHWGQRAVTGRLQSLISDLLQSQADLANSLGNYDTLVRGIQETVQNIEDQHKGAKSNLFHTKQGVINADVTGTLALTLRKTAAWMKFVKGQLDEARKWVVDKTPEEMIAGFSTGGDMAKAIKIPIGVGFVAGDTPIKAGMLGNETSSGCRRSRSGSVRPQDQFRTQSARTELQHAGFIVGVAAHAP